MWSDEEECVEEIEGRAALEVEEKDGRGALKEETEGRGPAVWKYDCWGIAGLVAYVENVGDVECPIDEVSSWDEKSDSLDTIAADVVYNADELLRSAAYFKARESGIRRIMAVA
jgi:hypothetical protein